MVSILVKRTRLGYRNVQFHPNTRVTSASHAVWRGVSRSCVGIGRTWYPMRPHA